MGHVTVAENHACQVSEAKWWLVIWLDDDDDGKGNDLIMMIMKTMR